MSLIWIIALFVTGIALVLYINTAGLKRQLVISGFWLTVAIGVAWGIVELSSNKPSNHVPSVFFWFTMLIITALSIFIWLMFNSGHNYNVHDTEAHASIYANEIKEGHGGLTAFLWVSFGLILVWTIVYLIQHWSEFGVIFGR